MNRSRQHLWTWLSVALYGAMTLGIHVLHTHGRGQCSSCGCVLSHQDARTAGRSSFASSDSAEDCAPGEQGEPFSPHEEDCPACRFLAQPTTLTAIVAPPKIGESFELAEFSQRPLHIATESTTPPVRGPPAL